MMTIQQIRVLLAIKEAKSMTRAAETLGCSVPTVVHHLDSLERIHEVQLVVRAKSGAELTPLGEMLANDGERILSQVTQAEHALATAREAGLSLFRIGSFASAGAKILPPAILELQRRSPVQVEVIESEPSDAVRLLRAGAIHAALIYDSVDAPMGMPANLQHHTLSEEPYRLLVSLSQAERMTEAVDFADLRHVGWVFSRTESEASDRIIRNEAQTAGFEPRVIARADDLSMIHGLVASGIGFGLSTETTVDYQYGLALRSTKQDLGRRRISFITRSEPRIAAVEMFLRILLEQTPSARPL